MTNHHLIYSLDFCSSLLIGLTASALAPLQSILKIVIRMIPLKLKSYRSISLGIKSKVFNGAQPHLGPCYFSDLMLYNFPTHSLQSSLFVIYIGHAKHSLASGPLHVLSTLPKMFIPSDNYMTFPFLHSILHLNAHSSYRASLKNLF